MPESAPAGSPTPTGRDGRPASSGGYPVHALEMGERNGPALLLLRSELSLLRSEGSGGCGSATRSPNGRRIGIGLEFQEVNQLSEAEVRIGYSTADGSSASAVGREVLDVPLNEPTTVYGWDLTTPYGRGTALHELGHVLGMEHEHQNPFAGIKWHEQAVYDALAKPPNSWDHDTTFHNILEKLTPQQVQGSTWDPDSIMEYEFEPGLIDEPEQYDVNGLTPPGTLSSADKEWALKWYPPLQATLPTLQPFQAVAVDLAAGQQVDFAIKPTDVAEVHDRDEGCLGHAARPVRGHQR